MERTIFGITKKTTADIIPIRIIGEDLTICLSRHTLSAAGVSLSGNQEVLIGMDADNEFVDVAPAPRAAELEVV